MPAPLYLVSLFYPTLADAAKQVREAKTEIEQMSGTNYKVLAYGGVTSCIGFVTDVPFADVRSRLGSIKGENYNYLVMQVTGPLGGVMSKQSWDWLLTRMPKE